jgi:hypothetical protein
MSSKDYTQADRDTSKQAWIDPFKPEQNPELPKVTAKKLAVALLGS